MVMCRPYRLLSTLAVLYSHVVFKKEQPVGKNCSVVATKRRGEEEDDVDIERIISESAMRKPWDAKVTPCPEHLFHFTSSATHHLPEYLYLLY
jgi:hypothetical protein